MTFSTPFMPDVKENPGLFHLVTTKQVHCHSNSRQKLKKCCYQFGNFLLITSQMVYNYKMTNSNSEKYILNKLEHIFSKVKH